MRQFGDLEALIMDVLWSEDSPQSVRSVLSRFSEDRNRAYTTVMTVLDNLHRMGFLARERVGRAYLYRPTRSREEHTAAVMEELLVGSGNPEATLLHFLGQMGAGDGTTQGGSRTGRGGPRTRVTASALLLGRPALTAPPVGASGPHTPA
jgi:predicted transcriptional regulator